MVANPARRFGARLALPRRRPARRQVMETGTARYGCAHRSLGGGGTRTPGGVGAGG